ncbi:ABC transporter substrate-binding protein [Clostridium sp. AM29-11AC]|uniref:ABC transporter substrate-binding protein n=1 Tax=Clostridium sp. AM29-11AC TaxID=2293028 RepID=UPI000E53AD8F|nr:ABC transporter substrate-binding protein [Clostridium sp. AM29-11AC]RHT57115.1 ABC transporter substrate-binding protein [Clostridium sp. AM29-11AC]
MRKRLLSFALCAAMALTAMTGCGAKTEDTAASSKGAETGSEAAKAEEEETEAAREADGEEKGLVIPSASCVANLNPLLESYKEGVIMLNPLYDPLYVIDVNETRYYLAESYEVSEDGTSVTLKLKDGLKWHDGEPITADDVIFTMDVNADTNNGAGNTNVVILNDQPVKYEKVDDLTVKITLPMASASYPALLGELTLIPEHVYGGNTSIVGAEANMSGIGSGPYKLREFKQDQYLILEKNEDYYMGAPDIDTVTFRIISDISAQEVALMNGEINLMELSSAPAVAKYSEDPNYTVVMYPEGRVNYLAVNKFCETVQDPKVVEAVFAALDAQEIIDGAYGEGMAVPANTVLSNMTTFYDESVEGYSQDIEKAKQLVAETGIEGSTMTLYFNSERAYMKESAQVIQQQLKNVGINLEVIPLESTGFFEKVFGTDGDYEFYLNGYAAVGDPDTVVAGMYDGTWGVNLAVSDELLGLWQEARSVFTEDERAAIYKEIQEKTKEEMSCYPIAYPNYVFVTTGNVKGTDTIKRTPIFEDYTKLTIE